MGAPRKLSTLKMFLNVPEAALGTRTFIYEVPGTNDFFGADRSFEGGYAFSHWNVVVNGPLHLSVDDDLEVARKDFTSYLKKEGFL
jgi:hypothetical protein